MQATLLKANAFTLLLAGGQEAVVAAMQRFPSVGYLQAHAVSCLELLGVWSGHRQELGSTNQVSTLF